MFKKPIMFVFATILLFSCVASAGPYSRVTGPERRYLIEQQRLAKAILRAMQYLDFSENEKEKLIGILGELQ